MQYRLLGRTGLRVSEVGCGGAPIGIANYNEGWDPHGDAETRSVVEALRHAVDGGYNYFDTAPSYGDGRSEELMGLTLEGVRSRVYVATKTAWKGRTKDQVIQSVEGSLRRLRTDYLDVIQIKYNVIYQGAWHNALQWAQEANVGVVTMRPLTSGIFQKLLRAAWPEIDQHVDLNEVALNFVLSDARVSTAIVGARRIAEIDANNALSDAVHKRLDLEWLQERKVPTPEAAAGQQPAAAPVG